MLLMWNVLYGTSTLSQRNILGVIPHLHTTLPYRILENPISYAIAHLTPLEQAFAAFYPLSATLILPAPENAWKWLWMAPGGPLAGFGCQPK